MADQKPVQKRRKLVHETSTSSKATVLPLPQESGSPKSTQVLTGSLVNDDAVVTDSDIPSSSEGEEALKLYDFSLWQYRHDEKRDGKDGKGGPHEAQVAGKRDQFDHILFWGKNHKMVLRGRPSPSMPQEYFFLHQVMLKRDLDGGPCLLGWGEQLGRPVEVLLEQEYLEYRDRGFEAIELLLDVADECQHIEREVCQETCLKRLKGQLDELYLSSENWQPSSDDSKRSAILTMLHLVRAELPNSMVLELLSHTTPYGKHAASPLVHRLAVEAGLFEHSLACNGTLPYECASEPPLPRKHSRKVFFADQGKRVAAGCYRYEAVYVERFAERDVDGCKLKRTERIKVGDFIAVDAPGGEWIARCISFRHDGEALAHLQWFTRQGVPRRISRLLSSVDLDATTLYNKGRFLQNELFARASCDDQPIGVIRGKVQVRILTTEDRAPEEALTSLQWVVRYAYDETASGRFLPFVDKQLNNEICYACIEQRLSLEENGDGNHPPQPSAGKGEVLLRFRGVSYHRNDCVAYGNVDCAQLVQIHSYNADAETIKARLFIRADLRNQVATAPCVATSGAPISHMQNERQLFCVPGYTTLPLVRNGKVLLGKEKVLLGNEFDSSGPESGPYDLPVLLDPLLQPYDFVVRGHCGKLTESIKTVLHSDPKLNFDNDHERSMLRDALYDITESHEPIRVCSLCRKERELASTRRQAFIDSTRSCVARKLQLLDVFGGFGGTALGILKALRALPLSPAKQAVLQKVKDKTKDRLRSDIVTLVAVDADTEAVAAYESNLPFSRVHSSDVDALVRQHVLDPVEARKGLLTSRRLDVLLLTPPCQAFSGMNRLRSVADHRAALIASGLSLVEALRPRIVLIEEVTGLVGFTDVYRLILRCLVALGYSVDSGVRCLSEYGLTQTRERCLIVATRLDCPKQCLLPLPTHERADRLSRPLTVPIEGTRDVSSPEEKIDLRHVSELTILTPPLFNQVLVDDLPPFDWHLTGETQLPDGSDVVPALPNSKAADFDDVGEHAAHSSRLDVRYGGRVMGWSHVDYRRSLPANALQRFFRTHHLTGDSVLEVTDHLTRPVSEGVIRAAYAEKFETEGPSNPHHLRARRGTITTRNKVGEPIGGNQRRTMSTIRELLREQGFPDSIVFPDGTSIAQREKLVGNSVSPFLSFHIGLSILDALVASPSKEV